MFGFIKRSYESIRKGNEYRLEKYGRPDTLEESYQKARKIAKDQRDSIPRPTQTTDQRNDILRHAAAWELWSGSRFIREDNPIHQMSKDDYRKSSWSNNGTAEFPTNQGYTARSCPVTGDYKKV